MVNIEQVRLLEQRVQKVIGRMAELRTENTELRERLGSYQDKINELEERIEGFSSNQEAIEQGILNALHQLDEVEDAVAGDSGESRIVEPEQQPVEEHPPQNEAAESQQHEEESFAPSVEPDEESDRLSELEEVEEEEGESPGGSPELDIF